jgi:FecR protein.
MRKMLDRVVAATLTLMAFAVAGTAQDRALTAAAGERYVISAKAGGVNFVQGDVGVVRKNGRSGVLLKRDELAIGDRVSTGPDGKVELLLNPGSYVRVGGNSAFEFRTVALSDLNLVVHRGSVIFEVFASNDFTVNVHGPKSKFVLVDSGVYRLDVDGDESKLSVWKGKARVGSETGQLMKGGRETTVDDGQIAVAKFDRDEKDSLDTWSKARSKELSKMLSSLDRDVMRTSLMRSFLGGRWNMSNSFGLWVYNPFGGSYCFMPFGYGWSSPYGYGYGRHLYWYNFPPVIYYPQNPPVITQPGGGNPPSTNGPIDRRGGGRMPTVGSAPPFTQMQKQEGGMIFPTGRGDNGRFPGADRGSSPSYNPGFPSAPGPSKSDSAAPTKQP